MDELVVPMRILENSQPGHADNQALSRVLAAVVDVREAPLVAKVKVVQFW